MHCSVIVLHSVSQILVCRKSWSRRRVQNYSTSLWKYSKVCELASALCILLTFKFLVCKDLLASYETTAQISTIEEMISQGADMQTVARLLCLASITTGGIKARLLENVKKEFLQARTDA